MTRLKHYTGHIRFQAVYIVPNTISFQISRPFNLNIHSRRVSTSLCVFLRFLSRTVNAFKLLLSIGPALLDSLGTSRFGSDEEHLMTTTQQASHSPCVSLDFSSRSLLTWLLSPTLWYILFLSRIGVQRWIALNLSCLPTLPCPSL